MGRIFLLAALAFPLPAQAAAEGGDLFSSSLKLIAALGVVLGIILILYWVGRRGVGFLPSAKGGIIKVVEMRPLGAKRSLCLVEVRGEEFLLGLGGDRVELLSPLGERSSKSFDEALQARMEEGR
ncbi:MAG: flagellar biosynthetic protein FliO [Desulfuromonas sp.]|uniref:FliO/MopB family protein n=1 Tax=Desulfuromonas sp. TaxID=892 RepID=UPI000CBF4239|nr:flagellar biosynthetic protein FliO [Desulfuromonas sp.]PLX84486.1 MAG: flagellar biosynthetic protein FliO [Desulfuromonas sp.]